MIRAVARSCIFSLVCAARVIYQSDSTRTRGAQRQPAMPSGPLNIYGLCRRRRPLRACVTGRQRQWLIHSTRVRELLGEFRIHKSGLQVQFYAVSNHKGVWGRPALVGSLATEGAPPEGVALPARARGSRWGRTIPHPYARVVCRRTISDLAPDYLPATTEKAATSATAATFPRSCVAVVAGVAASGDGAIISDIGVEN